MKTKTNEQPKTRNVKHSDTRIVSLKLTKTEAEQMLFLIEQNNRDGVYYGQEGHYRTRQERVRQKLNAQLFG